MSQQLSEFILYFKTLPLAEQMKLGSLFHQETKGRLSPFNSPFPVALALIPVATPVGLALLGGVRGINPGYGEIALPGGYVDAHEESHAAALREVYEETTLQLNPQYLKLLSTHTSKSNTLLIAYEYEAVLDHDIVTSLPITPEVLAHALIYKDTPLAFPIHTLLRDRFFAKH